MQVRTGAAKEKVEVIVKEMGKREKKRSAWHPVSQHLGLLCLQSPSFWKSYIWIFVQCTGFIKL